MSSRSGPNSHRRRSRDDNQRSSINGARDDHDGFPPLPPAPRLPTLSQLSNGRRDRERETNTGALSPSTASATVTAANIISSRTHRLWPNTAWRRAERIRLLENRAAQSQFYTYTPERNLPDADELATWSANFRRISSTNRGASADNGERSLDDNSTRLRALLTLASQPSTGLPRISAMPPVAVSPPQPRSHEFTDDSRRNKRRKIDPDRLVPSFKGFRYGKYGQVEQGQLHMEIVSCDGGMFSNESSYSADNILKDDNSVYCTKGNRCNIVLRHQGATVFTLQELVIKAPASMNYSHPVREGMVFISMNQDDLLSRTAQYQIQYVPRTRDSDSGSGNGEDWNEPERRPRRIVSIRHHDDGSEVRRSYNYQADDDENEQRTPHMPQEFASNLPDFRITTECSDDEEDLDNPRLFRRTPRIGTLPFENLDSDSDDAHPLLSLDIDGSSNGMRQALQLGRHSSLSEAWEAHANATQEAVRAVGGELLAPHARFFIEKKKSKCTIRFDPPVSGRFILLKMWSSRHDPNSNIDIQSVIARGFAGPRYFPSVELM